MHFSTIMPSLFKEGQTRAVIFWREHSDFWREHYLLLSNLNERGNTNQNPHVQVQKYILNFQNITPIYTFHELIEKLSLAHSTITLNIKTTLLFIIKFSKFSKIHMLT